MAMGRWVDESLHNFIGINFIVFFKKEIKFHIYEY